MFLVERLSVKHGCPRIDLLHTSFEMVVITLNLWTQKKIWAEVRQEDQWIMMGYATLAGAVLCMELIDPIPVSATPSADVIAGETYSRSSIIQQLSLLVGYLNSSGPSQPRNSVAHNVRDVIKKVLDHILNNVGGPGAPLGSDNFDFAIDWETFMELSSLDDVNWFTQSQGT
ncbi:hypothetical protein NW762_013844 [Fusarium torreyae]|uniref:Transcription factor domain-containing protein n=1 Tax=Fusarium torreyae TaxID=1237075 RepID=A0A9W8V717_9HYPO|nr:hypothetical protein NW762_013844 [Fusarium torreyae]